MTGFTGHGGRAARVTQIFDRLSGLYDIPALQSVVYRPPQDEILAILRREEARRIVDVGCGTGILASRIRSELDADEVYGCDLSDGMLDQARARSDRVTWLKAPSESLPFPDAALDAVVSSHAFHWFDQPRAAAEFRRVLAPGGVALVAILNPYTRAGSRVVNLTIAGNGHWPDVRAMRRLFTDSGFASVESQRVRRGGLQRLSPDAVTIARA